jgi:hypothetical protein
MLLIIAPLAMLMTVMVETRRMASLWSGAFLGLALSQQAQVLVLSLGTQLLSQQSEGRSVFSAVTLLTLAGCVMLSSLSVPLVLQQSLGTGLTLAGSMLTVPLRQTVQMVVGYGISRSGILKLARGLLLKGGHP